MAGLGRPYEGFSASPRRHHLDSGGTGLQTLLGAGCGFKEPSKGVTGTFIKDSAEQERPLFGLTGQTFCRSMFLWLRRTPYTGRPGHVGFVGSPESS